LSQIFYWRKIKYAIIPTEDFYRRLEFWDKLVKDILSEEWNIFLKDNLKIKEKFWIN
jgi:transcription elongation factor GreA-like protein